ncbi:lysine transporter LysE [Flavobacterium rhizosphaerae]|uniref:Lysine transporter LysE n=1 Tax=Flavobacterium rhizosphaerae TaxID=3163298 RepID=A0ABW8YYT9_9FLAO
MYIILPVVFGFLSSFLTTLMPGLLNITAAKICLKEGRSNAVIFSVGAACTVFVQAFIAVSFAKFIFSRPDIIYILQEAGIVIFALLSVFFFFIAKKPKQNPDSEIVNTRSGTGNFFLGVMLSALNLFPIPFYVAISIWLSQADYFNFDTLYIFLYVSGAMIGAFASFYVYVLFFRRFEDKAAFFLRNSNYFIGSITALIVVLTILRIWGN